MPSKGLLRILPTLLVLAIPIFAADDKCKDLTVVNEIKTDTTPPQTFSTSTKGALKDTITVLVQGLSNCLATATAVPKFVLYLDGKPLKGLQVTTPEQGHDHLQFFLDRIADNKDSWSALLRAPVFSRRVPLSVGLDAAQPMKSEVNEFELKIINGNWLTGWIVLFIFVLALFIWAAAASDILRESGPPPPDKDGKKQRKAYSLSRCQMAVWFFLIAMSFCLIFMITWDLGSISQGVLALMGISAGTGLAAAIVDTSKNSANDSNRQELLNQKASIDAEIQKLQSDLAAAKAANAANAPDLQQKLDVKQKSANEFQSQLDQINAQLATPAHTTLFEDLLSDANGLSFHRFQMFVWTIILAVIFVTSVRGDLIMPDFNATLLGLMGISAGTYVGFKFPEQKN